MLLIEISLIKFICVCVFVCVCKSKYVCIYIHEMYIILLKSEFIEEKINLDYFRHKQKKEKVQKQAFYFLIL